MLVKKSQFYEPRNVVTSMWRSRWLRRSRRHVAVATRSHDNSGVIMRWRLLTHSCPRPCADMQTSATVAFHRILL